MKTFIFKELEKLKKCISNLARTKIYISVNFLYTAKAMEHIGFNTFTRLGQRYG